jgi:hypothetical protein
MLGLALGAPSPRVCCGAMGQALLKVLAISVALLFLAGAVLTSSIDLFGLALAASPSNDAGPVADAGALERTYFSASKAGPLPRPKPVDAGEPVYFPASKSFGGGALPGLKQQLKQPQPSPQQNQAP